MPLKIINSGRILASSTDGGVLLAIDPSQVTFERQGNDLTLSTADGDITVFDDFFVTNRQPLSDFIMPDGKTVAGADFLAMQSPDLDLTTAMGPESAPPSSGAGEYQGDQGDLLGGLDRLGSLGTEQWERNTEAPELFVAQSGLPLADIAGTAGDAVGGLRFNARAVLYMQHEGDAPAAEPYTARSVTVQALARQGGRWGASGEEAASISAHPDNEPGVDALIEFETDGDGNITFRLTAAGKAWMDEHAGEDIVACYTITDAVGNSYTQQVVISADANFNSAVDHNDGLDPNGLIHGEWHEGRDTSADGGYNVTLSNLSDTMTFTGDIVGGNIATGHAANLAWGDDSVTVHGNVDKTSMDFGTGTGMLDIKKGLFAVEGSSRVAMDQGTIDINADKTSGQYGIRAEHTGSDNTSVTIDGGDSAVRIGAGAEGDHAYGVSAATGDGVAIKAGNVSVDVSGDFVSGIQAVGESLVDVTAGDVTILADGEKKSRGMYAADSRVSIHSDGGSVRIDARGDHGYGMSAEVNGGNLIDGAQKIDITGTLDAMCALSGGSNVINGGSEANLYGRSAGMLAHSAYNGHSSSNTITGVDTVRIGTEDDRGQLSLLAYDKAENIIEKAEQVDIYADLAGLTSSEGARNTIQADDVTLDVSRDDFTAVFGVVASSEGVNSISADSVKVKVAGGFSGYGMEADTQGENRITAGDVAITSITTADLESIAPEDVSNIGMDAANKGVNTIVSTGGTVSVTTQGGVGVGMSAGGADESANLIRGASKVTVATAVMGMSAVRGVNTITEIHGKAGETAVQVSAEGESVLGRAGMYAAKQRGNSVDTISENRITDITGNVAVTASGSGESTAAMSAYTATRNVDGGTARNSISDVRGDVTLSALHGEKNYGMRAYTEDAANPAANSIENVTGTATIEAEGTEATGMHVSGKNAKNSIQAGDVVIDAASTATLGGRAAGMYAENFGNNTVAADTVKIITRGDHPGSAAGMTAYDAHNSITASGSVSIAAERKAGGNYAILSKGNGAGNSIVAGGDVLISAGTEGPSRISVGMRADDDSSTTIRAEGDVVINVAAERRVEAMLVAGSDADNLIEAERVYITATANGTGVDDRAYGMHAYEIYPGSGVAPSNTIKASGDAITLIINVTAAAPEKAFAMLTDRTSSNRIIGGSGNDYIELHGRIVSQGGENSITTGAGDDTIVLDGAVQGLTLDAGEGGHDTLVLHAGSWQEFADRYQLWLEANFNSMNVESLEWQVADTAGGVPVWLRGVIDSHNALHPGAPLEVDYAAIAGPEAAMVAAAVNPASASDEGNDGDGGPTHAEDLSAGSGGGLTLRAAAHGGADDGPSDPNGGHDLPAANDDYVDAHTSLTPDIDPIQFSGGDNPLNSLTLNGGPDDDLFAFTGGGGRAGDILSLGGDTAHQPGGLFNPAPANAVSDVAPLLYFHDLADSIHLDDLLNAALPPDADNTEGVRQPLVGGDGNDHISTGENAAVNGLEDSGYTAASAANEKDMQVYIETMLQGSGGL